MISREKRKECAQVAAKAVVKHLEKEGYQTETKHWAPYVYEITLMDGDTYHGTISIAIAGKQA